MGCKNTPCTWLDGLKSAEKVALVGNNSKKIHYKFKDGREMVEEYNLETDVLVRRAWKTNNTILEKSRWQVEIGDPLLDTRDNNVNIGLFESKDTPHVVHRVTKTKLEWRIRNFRYTNDSQYSVTLDDSNEKCIIVRTTDKKFYKKIPLLDFQRLDLTPSRSSFKHSLSLGTLVIQLEKPPELLQLERELAKELKNVQVVDNADLNCNPS